MNKKTLFAAFILFPLTFVSCVSIPAKKVQRGTRIYTDSDSSGLQKKDSIYGHIFDSKSKKEVAGASVEIKNANLGVGYYKTKTDDKGFFQVKDFIPYLNYNIEVSKEGYVNYLSSGKIKPGLTKIFLVREGILKGTIKDSSGRVVEGVTLSLKRTTYRYPYRVSRPKAVKTGEDGAYQFNKIIESPYLLTIEKAGYIKETVSIKKIKSGETFSLPMVLLKPAFISGLIKIHNLDIPAINVGVNLRGRHYHATSSYEDGSYQLDDIKPGNYKIKLSHRGFYKIETKLIEIKEGDKIENLNFFVKPKSPKVVIHSYRYTFTPGMKLQFNLRTFRLEKYQATVYKVPLDYILVKRADPREIIPADEKFLALDTWEEPVKNFRAFEWRYQTITVSKPLSIGSYCLEVKGPGKVSDRKIFTVTSVGIVVKRSQQKALVYTTDLITNKPLGGASVILFDNTPVKKRYVNSSTPYKPPRRIDDLPVKVISNGISGVDGLTEFPLNNRKHLSVLAVAKDSSFALSNTGAPFDFKKETNKYYIYTERPVYRAGNTVYYKIIGKKRDKKFLPIKGKKLFYKIRNIDFNATIDEGTLHLDDWGTFHSQIKLSPEARLGEYVIHVGEKPKDLYSIGRFYVEQYRKPEFKIDITPGRGYYINGDKATFKIEAKYFFGAPLKGALVKYRFYETKLRDTGTRYWWEADYTGSGSYYRIKLEGEKYLDNNGVAALDIFVGNYSYDRKLTCEVTIVDKSNVVITSRKTVRVGRGEFYIKINPVKNFFADNDKEKQVRIRALTHLGEPISTSLKVELYRFVWKSWQRVYVHSGKPVFEKKITTNAKGEYLLKLPDKFYSYGEFDIIVKGVDRKDNVIQGSRVIWVYSASGGRISSRFGNLDLAINKSTLKSAGNITALIKSRFADSYVLVTLEGRDIYESRVLKLKGNILPVTFQIKKSYAPNLFIVATMQRKRALFTARKGVSLPTTDTRLFYKITSGKKSYMPGEEARIKIQVTDEDNKPVVTDLSLGAVDEAIYQIRPDHTPGMGNYFYTKISNWVMTRYSYPITLLAGAGKEGKVKIRSRFRDTAFWKADIKTDIAGLAEVSFKLPDNLTRWRLTVRGHDTRGRVGEKKEEIQVSQDLLVRIGKPRFFVERDKVSLIGIINNNSKRGLEKIKSYLYVANKEIAPDKRISISLPAYGSARSFYSIAIPEGKEILEILYKAIADKKARDGISIKIPIESRGVPYSIYGLGDMAANQRVVLKALSTTEDFDFLPDEIVIRLSPSPIMKMVKASKYLLKYPYGCVEQTINRFLPIVALKSFLETKNMGNLIQVKKLSDKARAGIRRIENIQNSDGTWGWWAGDRGNGFLTGYVMFALHRARELGFKTSLQRRKRGLRAITRMLKNRYKLDQDAFFYLLYVYALNGRWNERIFMDGLKLKNLNAYQLAYLIRAMLRVSNSRTLDPKTKNNIKKLIPKYLTQLKLLMKKDNRGIYFDSKGNKPWAWPGGRTEISAHVLSALAEAGDSSPIPGQLVSSISKRSRGPAWKSTKETATVFFALSDYLKGKSISLSNKGDVDFFLGKDKILNFKYNLSKMKKFNDLKDLSKKVKIQKTKKKQFEILARGEGGSDVSFDVTLKGNLYFKEGALGNLIKSRERSLQALNNGLSIQRSFYKVMRVRDVNNSEYMVPQGFSPGSSKAMVKVGDEVMVKIKFQAADDFEYLVLEDYLPSGFEVIKKNAYGEYTPFSHIERWDNRMVYFFNKLKKGKVYEVAYIIRAELPGKFLMKPSRMECMYEPSIQGWSNSVKFSVEKK